MTPEAKSKVLELVSEAIDKGGSVNIHLGQYDKSNDWKPVLRNDVESKVKELSSLFSTNIKEGHDNTANDFVVLYDDDFGPCVRVCFSYLTPGHKRYKEVAK